MQLSIVVPCFNEQPNIAELVSRVSHVLEQGGLRGELILIDDGSQDGTSEAIDQAANHHGFVRAVHHPCNKGIAEAWKSGARAAIGRHVCILDADLQYQPEDILRLYRELRRTHVDVVQGWRSPIGRQKQPRYYLSRGLNCFLNRAFSMRLKDNKSGFFICAREVLEDILAHKSSYYYFQSLVMVAAKAKGYSIKEVETLFLPRLEGESFLSRLPIKVVMRSFLDLGKGLIEYRMGQVRREPVQSPRAAECSAGPDTEGLPLSRRVSFDAYLTTFRATHWMMTSAVRAHYRSLQDSQYLAPEAVRELQEARLRRLVRHAYRSVPYYRDKMDALGLAPEAIRTLDDLGKLPLLSKEEIRRHLFFDLLAEDHNKAQMLRVSTSGSTGEPFVCYVDRSQLEFRWAATLRGMEWTGYRFGDKQMRLWHQTLGMTHAQAVRERLDAWANRRRFIPAYQMREDNLESVLQAIERYQPVLLDGYAESFNLLAHFLLGRGDPVKAQPKGVISSAQSLPQESRRAIEEAFGCAVFDKYGAREFSGIAYECDAHRGHHIVAEGYVVEILKNGRAALPGEVGEVVITDLNNFCLPFIRYRIGDLAEAMAPDERCPCGRGLPRIGRIEGRVQSIIVGADGQLLPGAFFAHLFKDYGHTVRHYQIEQERIGDVTVRIVKGDRFSRATMARIVDRLQHYLGPRTAVVVQFVDSIGMVRTGKRISCISHLAIDFQSSKHARLIARPSEA